MDAKPTTAPSAARTWLRRSPLVPTLAAIAGTLVFVSAGNWQRGRMEQKESLRAQFEAASRAAPEPLPAGEPDWQALRYRPVLLTGRYDAARQVLADNRVHAGRAGYHVVAPFVLDDGRVVLVNRGWIAAGATRRDVPLVPPPSGHVAVHGRVAMPAEGLRLGNDAPSGTVWQHVDPETFSQRTGLRVLPVVVEQSGDGAPADGLVRSWPAPDFGVEKHRIYMVQWYLFAALAVGLWLWFVARPAILARIRR